MFKAEITQSNEFATTFVVSIPEIFIEQFKNIINEFSSIKHFNENKNVYEIIKQIDENGFSPIEWLKNDGSQINEKELTMIGRNAFSTSDVCNLKWNKIKEIVTNNLIMFNEMNVGQKIVIELLRPFAFCEIEITKTQKQWQHLFSTMLIVDMHTRHIFDLMIIQYNKQF